MPTRSKPVVLVAEDDPIAMQLVAAELEAAGYQAVTCEDGITALEYVAFGGQLDALVTDIHMPNSIDGLFLATEARAMCPCLPVIYLSGRRVEAGQMVPGSHFLEKPYEKGRLPAVMDIAMCSAMANLMAETWSLRMEIKRTFLVCNSTWRAYVVNVEAVTDELFRLTDDVQIWLRRKGAQTWLTMRGMAAGARRMEFTCELTDAQEDTLVCSALDEGRIERVRHSVLHTGLTWTVDVYEGELSGFVIAEIELEREDQEITLPYWAGREVTGDPRFAQSAIREMGWRRD